MRGYGETDMNENRFDTVHLTRSPERFEVLQHTDGYADILLEGEMCPCNGFDEDERGFSHEHIYAKVICESDGALAIPPVKVTVENKKFSTLIKGIPVGGPYMIDFVFLKRESCSEYSIRGDKVYHIFVGDLYLIAGQSNAAGMARGELSETAEIGISVLRNLEAWDIATSPMADDTRHNMFLPFAKKIRKETGIPIGLIPSAVGGAPLSRWLPSEDGDLYRRAMNAVGGRKLRGVLWYQGCADAGDGYSTEQYVRRFSDFVSTLRRDVGDELLPVFTFQLNRQRRRDRDEELNELYDGIREAQRLVPHRIDGVYVLPAIDALNMSDFIHNSRPSNAMLGERLARQVLEKLYGKGLGADAPEIASATLAEDGVVVAEFANVREFLSDLNSRTDEYPLVVCDTDGAVGISGVRISADKICLTLARPVKLPATLSGQCGFSPLNIIIDYATGIPVLCFKNFPITAK